MIESGSISAYIAYLKKKFNISPSRTSRLKGMGKTMGSSRTTRKYDITPIASNNNFFKNTSLANITNLTNLSNLSNSSNIRNVNGFNPIHHVRNLTNNNNLQNYIKIKSPIFDQLENSKHYQDFQNLQKLQNSEELKEMIQIHELENIQNLQSSRSLIKKIKKNTTNLKNTHEEKESKNGNNFHLNSYLNLNLNKVPTFKNTQNFTGNNIPFKMSNLDSKLNSKYKPLNEKKKGSNIDELGYKCKCFLRGIESPHIKHSAKRNSDRKNPIHTKNLTNYFGRPPKILTITTSDLLSPNFSVTYLKNKEENGILNNSCSSSSASSYMFRFPTATCIHSKEKEKEKDLNQISNSQEDTVNFEAVKPLASRRAKELIGKEIEKIKSKSKSKSVSKHYSKDKDKERFKNLNKIHTPSKEAFVSKLYPNLNITNNDKIEKVFLGSQFEIPIETPKKEFHQPIIITNNMKTDLGKNNCLQNKLIVSEMPEHDKINEINETVQMSEPSIEIAMDKLVENAKKESIEGKNQEQSKSKDLKQDQSEENSSDILPTVFSDINININKGESENEVGGEKILGDEDKNNILVNNEKEIESRNSSEVENYDTKARERRIRVFINLASLIASETASPKSFRRKTRVG